VWKINFHSPNKNDWKQCVFYDTADSTGTGSATYPAWRRPVWYTPIAASGPNNTTLVYFSTGHVELRSDATNSTNINHLFAVMDADDPTSSTACSYAKKISVANKAGVDVNIPLITFEQGEKPITQAYVTNKMLIFKTYLPTSTDPCGVGTSRFWVVDYLSAAAVQDLNNDGTLDRYKKDDSTGDLAMANDKIWEVKTNGEPYSPAEFKSLSGNAMLWGEGVDFDCSGSCFTSP
jgi:Tfp pilus tip-associated adhesin PilY1